MYQTITAAKPAIFSVISRMALIMTNIKAILLSFQERFLNFNENIGISETNSHENRQTSANVSRG